MFKLKKDTNIDTWALPVTYEYVCF